MDNVRLIDKNALMEIVQKWRNQEAENDNSITGPAIIMAFDDVLDAIKAAPTIAPESLRPQWISVNDRLPEKSDTVLAWVVENGYEIEDGRIELSDYDSGGLWTDYDGEPLRYEPDCGILNKKDTYMDVTHWMPMPKPFGVLKKGESE